MRKRFHFHEQKWDLKSFMSQPRRGQHKCSSAPRSQTQIPSRCLSAALGAGHEAYERAARPHSPASWPCSFPPASARFVSRPHRQGPAAPRVVRAGRFAISSETGSPSCHSLALRFSELPALTRMRSKLTGPWARRSAAGPGHCLTECPPVYRPPPAGRSLMG